MPAFSFCQKSTKTFAKPCATFHLENAYYIVYTIYYKDGGANPRQKKGSNKNVKQNLRRLHAIK